MEKKIEILYKHLTKCEKIAFAVTFIVGILSHLYIYTNTIPNFDGISRMYDAQQMTISGRWFLHYASFLNLHTQMPMVIGIWSMFFLALSNVLIIRMIKMESCIWTGIWGSLFAVFPAMADTNAYTYTASAYCLAIFGAVLGVYITRKKRWGLIPGGILLAFSMGIYQTYVTIAIVLSVLLILNDALSKESKVSEILLESGKFILHLVLGTILYYVILKIFLYVKELQLWSYLGMDGVEKGYPIGQLKDTLQKTYVQVWNFFGGRSDGLESIWYLTGNAVIFLGSLIVLIAIIKERQLYKEKIKLWGIMALIILLPVSANFTQVISPFSKPRLIMKYAYVFLYLLPIILLNQIRSTSMLKKMQEGIAVLTMAVYMLQILYFWQYDNVMYTMLNQAHRATLSFVTNVVSRVESCEGYKHGMQVVVIGKFPMDKYGTNLDIYKYVESSSSLSDTVIPLNKHIYYYMHNWLNVPAEEPSDELCFNIAGSEKFQQMTLYPDDGSVGIIGDCVVVKMADTFSPKSEYEKQYDNRR